MLSHGARKVQLANPRYASRRLATACRSGSFHASRRRTTNLHRYRLRSLTSVPYRAEDDDQDGHRRSKHGNRRHRGSMINDLRGFGQRNHGQGPADRSDHCRQNVADSALPDQQRSGNELRNADQELAQQVAMELIDQDPATVSYPDRDSTPAQHVENYGTYSCHEVCRVRGTTNYWRKQDPHRMNRRSDGEFGGANWSSRMQSSARFWQSSRPGL